MLNKLINIFRLANPFCCHDYKVLKNNVNSVEYYTGIKKCSKCHKEIVGGTIVLKHGDWLFRK